MDLTAFAAEVGATGPVTVAGAGTRGGPCPEARVVHAPTGIERIDPEEMTVACAAGTRVDELVAALAPSGQTVSLPSGGTVGGALAVGRSGLRLLGDGPLRNTLLQMHYVSAAGEVVMAGGPTVKNVSGFDLCRLFVGARGTLGFIGSVVLRTRPIARHSQWFTTPTTDPSDLQSSLYKPVSLLWDGATLWVLLEGHPDDVATQARRHGLVPAGGPPSLPVHRSTIRPADVGSLRGRYVALLGTGVVYTDEARAVLPADPRLLALQAAVKARFDPHGRLNPSVDVAVPR